MRSLLCRRDPGNLLAPSGRGQGGFDEIGAMASGRAGRHDAASSVARVSPDTRAPCVLASRPPAHPETVAHSVKPSSWLTPPVLVLENGLVDVGGGEFRRTTVSVADGRVVAEEPD